MSATQTYEDYLRGQVERGQYGVAIIQAQIALDIAEYIEKHRQPTIEPERKKGRWIDGKVKHIKNGELRTMRECSECGACYFVYDSYNSVEDIPNYCPNCGAEMEDNNL